jgi:hypothetical protein
MKLALALGVVSLFVLTGCAARGVGAFRTVISPSCLTAPVVMKDCNASNGFTRCREVEVRYRPSCAQIQVKKRGGPSSTK